MSHDTCDEWPFKCGEWLHFQKSQNLDVLGKTTQDSISFTKFTLLTHQNGVKTHGSGRKMCIQAWLIYWDVFATFEAILVKF